MQIRSHLCSEPRSVFHIPEKNPSPAKAPRNPLLLPSLSRHQPHWPPCCSSNISQSPAPGPLHRLCALPGKPSLRESARLIPSFRSGSPLNATSSERTSLATASETHFPLLGFLHRVSSRCYVAVTCSLLSSPARGRGSSAFPLLCPQR